MAAKVWSHETVPVKIITDVLSRENQIRLAIFLNGSRVRKLAANVGDEDQYDPISVAPDDLDSRLRHARQVIQFRIEDDISFTKIISRRRKEFTADFESAVESALETARTLATFSAMWDKEPPLPIAAAVKCSKDCVFQLSLLQNSASKEMLKH